MASKKTCPVKQDETNVRILGANEPGPRLEEIDDSDSARFEPSDVDWRVPGIIEVEFTDAIHSGVETDSFAPGERKEFSKNWSAGFRKVIESHGLATWKPSFPVLHPWSTEDSIESERKFYRESGRDRFITLRFTGEADVLQIANELRELPEIAQAVAMPQLAPPFGPLDEPLMGTSDQVTNTVCGSDSCLQNQWYIFRCGIDKAWTHASGAGVTIADIDWGFNPLHQDLEPGITLTQSMLPFTNSTIVANGQRCDHGTAVLGLAGARVNSLGMAGVAFEANLWAIQAGSETSIDHALWVAAVDFVRQQPSAGRKVIILEIQTRKCGNIEMSPTINKAILDAIAGDIVVCVPAGNGNATRDAGLGDDGNPIPPTGSILVGATKFDSLGNIFASSNGGPRIVVYAPGDRTHDLTCGLTNDKYRNQFGGTSGAVAKVAGTAALMLQVNATLTHAEVRDILRMSQTPVFDNGTQVGVLLDAEQAVCEALTRAGGHC